MLDNQSPNTPQYWCHSLTFWMSTINFSNILIIFIVLKRWKRYWLACTTVNVQSAQTESWCLHTPQNVSLNIHRIVSALSYTLPFGAGVLPPSAEAFSGPSAHPRINHKVIETFYRFLQTWGGYYSVPVLGHPVLRNTFRRIHIVSQRVIKSEKMFWPVKSTESESVTSADIVILILTVSICTVNVIAVCHSVLEVLSIFWLCLHPQNEIDCDTMDVF